MRTILLLLLPVSLVAQGFPPASNPLTGGSAGQFLTKNSSTSYDWAWSTFFGSSSITTVGTVGTGTWQGTAIAGQYGGTGVANTGKTITLGNNPTTSGNFALTLTQTGTTNVTLPTTGTLSTLAGSEAISGKTIATFNYAADAGSNDSYVISLSPAPAAYTTGMIVFFKANTVNTGAASININSLGVKTIVKRVSTTLANADIPALGLCMIIYDGTNFVLLNPVVN